MSKKRNQTGLLVLLLLLAGIGAMLFTLNHRGFFTETAAAKRELARRGIPAEEQSVREALAQGNVDSLNLLETAGLLMFLVDRESGSSSLIELVKAKRLDLVKDHLTRRGVADQIDHRDNVGLSALSHALQLNGRYRSPLVNALFSAGATGETPIRPGQPALLEAVELNDLDLAQQLLSAKAHPNTSSSEGVNPLWVAVSEEEFAMIDLLLDAGASPDASSPEGRPMVHVAMTSQRWEKLADRLLQAGAEIDQKYLGLTPLRIATAAADETKIRALLKWQAQLESAEWPDSPTLLADSIEDGHLRVAEILIETGADVANGGSGPTPLRVAWLNRNYDAVQLLLNAGAKPQPLFRQAIQTKDWRLLDLLVAAGADISVPFKEGAAVPVIAAYEEQDLDLLEQLLKHGADPESMAPEGQPLLAVATARGQAATVALLVKHGAQADRLISAPAPKSFRQLFPDDENLRHYLLADSNISPVMLAAARGDTETMAVLLEARVKRWRTTTRYKSHALYLAGMRRHAGVQQQILGRDYGTSQPRKIVISLDKQWATFYKNGAVFASSKVSTGMKGYRTPTGHFVITSKHPDHRSNLYDDAEMPFFMRLSCDAFGMHQGICPGYAASHGCIRMPERKAKFFYEHTKVGDLVVITN